MGIIESVVGLDALVGPYGPLSLLFTLALLIPGLAVTVRRLHDTNRSGWWILLLLPYVLFAITATGAVVGGSMASGGLAMLIGFVALAGVIALLVFMVLPGTTGDNRYGPDPYGGEAAPAAA